MSVYQQSVRELAQEIVRKIEIEISGDLTNITNRTLAVANLLRGKTETQHLARDLDDIVRTIDDLKRKVGYKY